MMAKDKFYLGDLTNEQAAFLKHMISIGKCGLTIMEKMEMGDPNRIYIAKIMTKRQKNIEFTWTKQ